MFVCHFILSMTFLPYMHLNLYILYVSESKRQALRKEMKQTMKFAYAESTFKNLRIQWETFLMFYFYFKLEPLPVSVETLCLYGQFLNRSFRSVQSIQNYLSGVKTLHAILDIEYPTSDLLQLKLLLKGISRIKQHVPKKAAPITPQILKEIFMFLNFENSFDRVLWALFLLMFFLMARKSNMIPTSIKKFDSKKQLTRGDLRLENNVLTVNFKWSKTRQFGHSRYIPLTAIPDSCLCPVKAYANVLSTINCSNYDSAFCYYNGRSQTVPILYSQFQRRLRELIGLTGRDGNSFSSHSFRRGGCSLAFRSNVESELIQYHGDWLSSVYTEYLTYDYDQKLSVSRRMVNRILHDS